MKAYIRTPMTLTAGLLMACGTAAAADTTPDALPVTPVTQAEAEEIVVLSPFEVISDRDVGYLAQNTLAGSRLNTPLMDTGAAISVLTPEFIKDIGATNMKDVILFQNNAVPDFGDADSNFNGNPMIGNSEWQLRIRGLEATYARNYFPWMVSTDFYNVERIDQSRGPNSILFGFGSAGGIVNSTTKQAMLAPVQDEASITFGSWDRVRGSVDANTILIPGELALRVNAMAERGNTWREFEYDRAARADLAARWQINKASSLRAEAEVGRIEDNITRPWLAIDESFLWREAGRPTYTSQWPDTSWGSTIDSYWPEHLVAGDDGVVRDWLGFGFASNANTGFDYSDWQAPTWSQIAFTPENLAIIPKDSNLAGPDAERTTTYHTASAFYENQVTEQLWIELAVNYQRMKFLGYDANGSRATTYYGDCTELWGDPNVYLPDWSLNPNAGRLYLENNWTRRHQDREATFLRGTGSYEFETGDWASHRFALMYEFSSSDYYSLEECEAFLERPFPTYAPEDDRNRLYRRHYFTEGDASDIHVQSWKNAVQGAGWVPTQDIVDSTTDQHTVLAALQSEFFDKHLVTTAGLRFDWVNHDWYSTVRDANTGCWALDRTDDLSESMDATTFTLGAVYHINDTISVYGNHSNNRDIPNFNIHLVDSYIAPLIKGEGNDVGLKFNLLGGRVFATVSYYTTKQDNVTDWGNVAEMVALNNRVLDALQGAGLITAEENQARQMSTSINGYLQDRDADGFEFQVVANPTPNWRISANFSINNIEYKNIMADVKAWADTTTAFWLSRADPGFLLGQGDWDTLINQIGWKFAEVYDVEGTDPTLWGPGTVTGLEGRQARGQRKYGANLYTKYTFSSGPLKNLSIGGGGRYQSANVLGYYYGKVCEGRSLLLFDASLGYSFKTECFGKGSWMDLQFNVSNLLDEDDYQIYTLAWWDPSTSVPERIGMQEPRRYTFTATIHL